jgi:hypothetical protein
MTDDVGGRGRYPIERARFSFNGAAQRQSRIAQQCRRGLIAGCARKQIAVAGITGVEQAGTGGANFVDALKLV